MKYTTKKQDAAFIANLLTQSKKAWAVGDACRPYKGTVATRVKSIEGEIVRLENGESMHISKMRAV